MERGDEKGQDEKISKADAKAMAEFAGRIAAADAIMRANIGQVEILADSSGNLYPSPKKLRQERGANNRFGAGPRRKRGRRPKVTPADYCPRIRRVEIVEDPECT